MQDDNFVNVSLLTDDPKVEQKTTKTRKTIIGATFIGVAAMLVVACSG